MKLQTRNWSAKRMPETPAGGKKILLVTGEVQTTSTNQTPKLAETNPPGFNPTILLVTLSVDVSGPGNEVLSWKSVEYKKTDNVDEYSSVTINGDCDDVTVPVVDVES